MSGGSFDYNQFSMQDIVDQIERVVTNNRREDDWGYSTSFSGDTIREFKKGMQAIEIASMYLHRIDWLISGDDGEDAFHEHLSEDLAKLQKKGKHDS